MISVMGKLDFPLKIVFFPYLAAFRPSFLYKLYIGHYTLKEFHLKYIVIVKWWNFEIRRVQNWSQRMEAPLNVWPLGQTAYSL